MSCCGQQRAAATIEGGVAVDEGVPVWFSYTGLRTIVVRGPVTGRAYRFLPGNLLRVHAGDVPSMHGIPGLKRRDGGVLADNVSF